MSTTTAAITAKCTRCGRTLTSARSISNGYGRTCKTKIAAGAKTADLVDFKPAQVESARELIEDAAIVQIRRNVFRAVSTDGTETYLAHTANCTCAAGIRGRRCYHMAAVRMLLAA